MFGKILNVFLSFLCLVAFMFIYGLLLGVFAVPMFLVFNINAENYIYVFVLTFISAIIRIKITNLSHIYLPRK